MKYVRVPYRFFRFPSAGGAVVAATVILLAAAMGTGCGVGDVEEGTSLDEYDAGPVIRSISPEAGPPGVSVSILGEAFSSDPDSNRVTFGGEPAPVMSATDTLLVAEVPDSATTGPVEVTARGQTAVGPEFMVEEAMPAITALEPDSGTVGTNVTIRGMNFDPDPSGNDVRFNGVAATVSQASDTLLLTQVPAGATTGPVEVTVRGLTAVGPVFNVITTGTVRVFVSTTGPDPDSDGYTLLLDGSVNLAAAIDDTVAFDDVEEGTHDLELTGLAANCSTGASNPRSISVAAGDTTESSFSVTCSDIIRNQIVFHTDRDGNQEIYLMNTDGSGQTNLTGNAASDFHPAVSPDGSRIAFVSDRDGNDEIHMMNADGSNVTQITVTTGVPNSQPAWSPSGDRIAFTRFTGAQNFEVFVIDTSGSGETNLTTHQADDGQPDWSPDGGSILFVSTRDGDEELFTMNTDGSGVTQLTNNTLSDLAPAWSPDGSQIAFRLDSLQSDDIFIMDADGSNPVAVTMDLAADDLPDWSPGGSRLVFQSDSSGDLEIWRIDTDGSNRTNLSNSGISDDEHPAWSPVQ